MKKKNWLFQEREAYEHGFSKFYANNIYPMQEKLERTRRSILSRFISRVISVIFVFSGLFFIPLFICAKTTGVFEGVESWKLYTMAIVLLLFVAVITVIGGVFSSSSFFYYKRLSKYEILKRAVKFYKGFEYEVYNDICPLDMHFSEILPKYDSYEGEDKISGKIGKIKVEMAEVILRGKPGKVRGFFKFLAKMSLFFGAMFGGGPVGVVSLLASLEQIKEGESQQINKMQQHFSDRANRGRAVFKGVFVVFTMPKDYEGITMGLKDKGELGNAIRKLSVKKHLKKVHLESGEFEKLFEVYSNSQIESRVLLNPLFMERVLDLANAINRKKGTFRKGVSFSFFEDKCLLMVPTSRDLFEPRTILKSRVHVKDIKRFLKEMSIIFEIAEILKLNNKKAGK